MNLATVIFRDRVTGSDVIDSSDFDSIGYCDSSDCLGAVVGRVEKERNQMIKSLLLPGNASGPGFQGRRIYIFTFSAVTTRRGQESDDDSVDLKSTAITRNRYAIRNASYFDASALSSFWRRIA
jgi:hypothetical protein